MGEISWSHMTHRYKYARASAEAEGMTDIRTADWSEEVAPFWKAVIQTALSGAGFAGLMRAGWTTIKVGVYACCRRLR